LSQCRISIPSDSNFLKECYVKKLGPRTYKLFLKIDRDADAQSLGRTYRIYAVIADVCNNEATVMREGFIPKDEFVYEHRMPCPAGPVTYKANEPNFV
jgi:hypothetical protein